MTKFLADLLTMDKISSRYGCSLKPRLREAIAADLRFPAHAASPQRQDVLSEEELPENVRSLSSHAAKNERKRA